MKSMNKSKVMGCLALLSFVILAALWVYSNHSQSGNKNKYVREYVIGAPGIKGSVDITQWEMIRHITLGQTAKVMQFSRTQNRCSPG